VSEFLLGKVYIVIPHSWAEADGLLRVMDEDAED